MKFIKNDGGREESGFSKGKGDCVIRAIAIAANLSYLEVYENILARAVDRKANYNPQNGSRKSEYGPYLEYLGFVYTDLREIGKPRIRLNKKFEEILPIKMGIIFMKRHLTVYMDGEIHDMWDCSKTGRKWVNGYWAKCY